MADLLLLPALSLLVRCVEKVLNNIFLQMVVKNSDLPWYEVRKNTLNILKQIQAQGIC